MQKRKSDAYRVYLKSMGPYYLMLLPGVILIIMFRFWPLYGLTAAFKDYNLTKNLAECEWVGFKWFKLLFESRDFLNILRNTLVINILELLFVFGGSIVLAVLINEISNTRYKKIVQTISYIPHFLSWVVVGGLVIQLLTSTGIISRIVALVTHTTPTNLLLKEDYFWLIVSLGEMWKSVGWGTILFLAAMSGINQELYEAAKIDGASRIQRILHITLPGIKYIIVLQMLMRIGNMMNVGFEKVFVLQNDMILDTAEVFSTYNYKAGIIQWRTSYSTALSVFESLVNFALVFIFDRIAKLLGEEGLL